MAGRKKVRVRGKVSLEQVLRKTASEHEAVIIETDQGERLVLQRIGGNPFEDESTRRLVGRTVEVEGFRLGRILRYVDVHDAE